MTKIIYEINGRGILPYDTQIYGVKGFISWRRLSEVFKESGEIKENETLKAFEITERGIEFSVEYTPLSFNIRIGILDLTAASRALGEVKIVAAGSMYATLESDEKQRAKLVAAKIQFTRD